MSDYAAARPTPWRYRLFPQQPFPPFPSEGFVLRTETVVRLDWKDRLRILLTGWAVVKVQSTTDVEVKTSASTATFAVLPGDPALPEVWFDAKGVPRANWPPPPEPPPEGKA